MSDHRLRLRPRRSHLRLAIMALGAAAILGGVALVVMPLLNVLHRGHTDAAALKSWQSGPPALQGAPQATFAAPAVVSCGSASSSDYALVSFNAPAAEHYAGVATDGTWDQLFDRSMVHYKGTPAPGEQGNSIIAFHREPDFEHIDQLKVGDTITVEDRSCHSFTYQVTGRWVLNPTSVTQLTPTTGHDLTLITCTPFWVDTQRIVWRASLVTPTS